MSTCPRCFHPVRDQDRVSSVEVGDDTGDLYDCDYCRQWFILFADGSTAAVEAE